MIFFLMIDENETLVARWKDNSMVFVASTVHRVGPVIKRMRKRPRLNATNKKHVLKVWGDDGKVSINIPTLIDDYNHWMGNVDIADQLISYYHLNLRCFRTWTPMFLQLLSMIRSNSYLVYLSYQDRLNRGKKLTHKVFILSFIKTLINEAMYFHRNSSSHLKSLCPHHH